MDNIITPYGRLAWFEATKADDKGFFKTAFLLPKGEEAMAPLVELGLSKEIVKSNLQDVEKFIKDISAMVKEDGKHPAFNPKKMFKDGDVKSEEAVDSFKANPENEGRDVPAYCYFTKGMWVINLKTKFDLEFYGPRKSEGVRDATWADDNLYSGCWARLITKPYAFNVDGNKGYTFGLGKWIQKWADGENFGAKSETTTSTDVEDAVEFTPTAKASDYID